MALEGEPPVGSPKKTSTKTRHLSRWQKSGGPTALPQLRTSPCECRPDLPIGPVTEAWRDDYCICSSLCYALFSDIEKSVQHLWEFTFCCFEWCQYILHHLLPAMQERTRKKMVCLALWLALWWDRDGYTKSILILTLLEYVRQLPEQERVWLPVEWSWFADMFMDCFRPHL